MRSPIRGQQPTVFSISARSILWGALPAQIGFLLVQTGITSTGFTYNGKNERNQPKWDRVETINPVACELDPDIRQKIASWNISVQKWLRRYVYERCCPESDLKANKRKAERAQILTMVTSAIWHGFYPGYYFCFIQLSFIVTFCKKVFVLSKLQQNRLQRLRKLVTKPVYEVAKRAFIIMLICYLEVPFYSLGFTRTLAFYANISWSMPLLVLGMIVFNHAVRVKTPAKND